MEFAISALYLIAAEMVAALKAPTRIISIEVQVPAQTAGTLANLI